MSVIPRIESLTVKNFRALKHVELKDLTPMTVLIGPNGSGKSTVLDVLAFLRECFEDGLRRAWERRGGGQEIKSRGCEGPVAIEMTYRSAEHGRMTYSLAFDEEGAHPVVQHEGLTGALDPPALVMEFAFGRGEIFQHGHKLERRVPVVHHFASKDALAAGVLGQLTDYPPLLDLRAFALGWHLSSLSIDGIRSERPAGPAPLLSQTGDNLANVIEYLQAQPQGHWGLILQKLGRTVPRLEGVTAEEAPNGRVSIKIKDSPFVSPILARFASEGTLKLLALLILMNNPNPPTLLTVEEPENALEPRLLAELGEQFRAASERSQVMLTTHAPPFMYAMRPEEVRFLWRDRSGFTQTRKVSSIPLVQAFVEEGASLGELWMEGHFDVGHPLYPDQER